jgi:hypothetical protein
MEPNMAVITSKAPGARIAESPREKPHHTPDTGSHADAKRKATVAAHQQDHVDAIIRNQTPGNGANLGNSKSRG